jgi:hypothetical protein
MPARFKTDEQVLRLMALVVSVLAYAYFSGQGAILLYGDAVAHINIARRVVDSLTPGPLQLGTVWLPLPHILITPLVWVDELWRSGIAGSVPSMIAFGIATSGIFRLVSIVGSRASAWMAALVFLANPNLLYLQSTAMTEAISLAAIVWAAAYFVEFWVATRHARFERAGSALRNSGIALLVATLTRYDGWFLAGVTMLLVLGRFAYVKTRTEANLGKPVFTFLLLTVASPVLWLAFNLAVFKNPVEFATGPYSARAIMKRTSNGFVHPGHGGVPKASSYYLKVAKLNMGSERWGEWIFRIAALASLIAIIDRRFRPALLLWALWPFYTLSVAYGGVPIFFPEWWPHSYYNVRYGIALLPAIAVFFAIGYEMLRRVNWNRAYTATLPIVFALTAIVSYWSVWSATPIALREAQANSRTRLPYEKTLAAELGKLPPDAKLLMFTGTYSGALQQTGIPFRRVVNEGNYKLWERALNAPAASADYVIATDGDPVAEAVAKNGTGLESIAVVHGQERAPTVIYKSIATRSN